MNEEFTFFWKDKDPFSQWHKAGFTIDGVHFKTAEHYMMYKKAELFKDEEAMKGVLECKHPREVKAWGRRVKNFDSVTWDAHKIHIVYEGNKAKFEQNPHCYEALEKTVGTTLVEASPYDRVWGIGLEETDDRAHNRSTWRGENLLGVVLTDLRINMIGK